MSRASIVLGLTLLLSEAAASEAGTYAIDGPSVEVAVRKGKRQLARYLRVEAGAVLSFQATGPARAEIELRFDLRRRGRIPKGINIELTIDGKASEKRIRPRRQKGIRYGDRRDVVPSRAATLALELDAGEHQVALKLPAGVGAVVRVIGLTRRVKEPAPEPPEIPLAAAVPPEPPTAPEPPAPQPTPAATTPSEAETAVEAPALEPAVEDPPLVALTRQEGTHEIRAAEVETPTLGTDDSIALEKATTVGVVEAKGLVRVGPKIGGTLPRGDLKPGSYVGLLVEMPLSAIGMPADLSLAGWSMDLNAYLEGGWSPMRQQDEVLIRGRGRTQLTQNSLILPFELGLRARLDFSMPVQAYAALGLAMDVSRTELKAFSAPPVQQNDVSLGVAIAVGGYLPLGPGGVLAELRYREVRTDLGEFRDVAEPTLATAALHVGYIFALGQ